MGCEVKDGGGFEWGWQKIQVKWDYIGLGEDKVQTDIKYDDEKPTRAVGWQTMDTDVAQRTFHQERHWKTAADKIRSMSRLAIRIYDYRNRPITRVFPGTGSSRALGWVFEKCKIAD